MSEEKRPSAFVSYAQSSPRWQADVLSFTIALRVSGGVDAQIDMFHRSDHRRWSTFGTELIEESDFVLIAVDPAYKRRWFGRDKKGAGAGVAREAGAIRTILEQDQADFLKRVKVILLPGARSRDIPEDLRGICEWFRIDSFDLAGIEELLRSIYDRPAFPKPPLGEIPLLPPKLIETLQDERSEGDDGRTRPLESDTPRGGEARAEEVLRTELGRVSAALAGGESTPAGLAGLETHDLEAQRTALEVSLDAIDDSRRPRRARRPRHAGRRLRTTAARLAPAFRRAANVALLLAGAAMAIGGVVLAAEAVRADPAPSADVVAERAGVSLKAPPGWRRSSDAVTAGLQVREPIALSGPTAAGERRLSVTAGLSDAFGVALLPRPYRIQLGDGTRRVAVALGPLQAYRYTGLRTPSGQPLIAYVAPTSAGVATVACRLPEGGGGDRASERCARIAGTLRLDRGEPYPLGPSPALARALRRLLPEFKSRRRDGIEKMRAADDAAEQAEAAEEVAEAFRAAARRLASVPISPESETDRNRIVAAMRQTRDAYRRLAAAARREDRGAYAATEEAARFGEAEVGAHLGQLHELGYRVGPQASAGDASPPSGGAG